MPWGAGVDSGTGGPGSEEGQRGWQLRDRRHLHIPAPGRGEPLPAHRCCRGTHTSSLITDGGGDGWHSGMNYSQLPDAALKKRYLAKSQAVVFFFFLFHPARFGDERDTFDLLAKMKLPELPPVFCGVMLCSR